MARLEGPVVGRAPWRAGYCGALDAVSAQAASSDDAAGRHGTRRCALASHSERRQGGEARLARVDVWMHLGMLGLWDGHRRDEDRDMRRL